MKTRHLIGALVVAGGVAAMFAEAAAESPSDDVWTIADVRLRARPGETAPVVGRADKGDRLAVVARQGRWLRVRRGRRVGWVTRTQVEDRGDGDRSARARPKRSGFSGKPVGAAMKAKVVIDKVRGFDDPVTQASCVLELSRGDEVAVLGRGHDGWLLVDGGRGRGVGWIPAAAVGDGGAFAGDPRLAPAEDDPRIVVMAPGPEAVARGTTMPRGTAMVARRTTAVARRMTIDAIASVGAQAFAMRQVGTGPAMAIAKGPAAAIGAGAHVRISRAVWIGGGVDAELGSAALVYYTAAEASAEMATRGVAVDARGELAWGQRKRIAARAGYHYGSLAIDSERSEPMLIGEQVGGVTAGVGGAFPLGRLAVQAAIDVMPAGAQRPSRQPVGVLYATGMRAAWAHATVAMGLPAGLVAAVTYRGGLARVDLTDGAATPSYATRNDQSHTITAGVGVRW